VRFSLCGPQTLSPPRESARKQLLFLLGNELTSFLLEPRLFENYPPSRFITLDSALPSFPLVRLYVMNFSFLLQKEGLPPELGNRLPPIGNFGFFSAEQFAFFAAISQIAPAFPFPPYFVLYEPSPPPPPPNFFLGLSGNAVAFVSAFLVDPQSKPSCVGLTVSVPIFFLPCKQRI